MKACSLISQRLLGLSILLTSGFIANAQTEPESDATRVGILPTQKVGMLVPSDAPNPFAQAAKKEEEKQATGKEMSEEDRIRAVFSQLRVSGVVDGPSGKRLLVGDLILEKGGTGPTLLEDQTEELVVTGVTDQEVEITWVEKPNHKGEPRRLVIPVDLRPKVRHVLRGQPLNENPRIGVTTASVQNETKVETGRHWANEPSATAE